LSLAFYLVGFACQYPNRQENTSERKETKYGNGLSKKEKKKKERGNRNVMQGAVKVVVRAAMRVIRCLDDQRLNKTWKASHLS